MIGLIFPRQKGRPGSERIKPAAENQPATGFIYAGELSSPLRLISGSQVEVNEGLRRQALPTHAAGDSSTISASVRTIFRSRVMTALSPLCNAKRALQYIGLEELWGAYGIGGIEVSFPSILGPGEPTRVGSLLCKRGAGKEAKRREICGFHSPHTMEGTSRDHGWQSVKPTGD